MVWQSNFIFLHGDKVFISVLVCVCVCSWMNTGAVVIQCVRRSQDNISCWSLSSFFALDLLVLAAVQPGWLACELWLWFYLCLLSCPEEHLDYWCKQWMTSLMWILGPHVSVARDLLTPPPQLDIHRCLMMLSERMFLHVSLSYIWSEIQFTSLWAVTYCP